MISVSEATHIIRSEQKDYGVEYVPLAEASGRVLAEDLVTDRDMPPFDRVTMDGIALRFADLAAGCRKLSIAGIQAAGAPPIPALPPNSCFEIMTGAICPPEADTVIPYEKLRISEGLAQVDPDAHPVSPGQNIHRRGHDRRQGDLLVPSGALIDPVVVSVAATTGKTVLKVRQRPRVLILSSGDELVDVPETPLAHQIRRSNSYALAAALRPYGIQAEMQHLRDDLALIQSAIPHFLAHFDVILISGGVSMGKFDFIPEALESAGVQKHFHKVRQRPGKPFWFGTFGERGVVFALPGNPVSTFLCLYRYVLPWLEGSLGFPAKAPMQAVLAKDMRFLPDLQYFVQVVLKQGDDTRLWAEPLEGHGSGDFANLLDTNAFIELPADKTDFSAGEVYPLIRYKPF